MVESSGLLNRRRVKSSTGSSNLPLSAIAFKQLLHVSAPTFLELLQAAEPLGW